MIQTIERWVILVMGFIILVLACIVIWSGCNPLPPQVVTVTTVDTVWLTSPPDTQYLPAPVLVKEEAQPVPPQYLPSADCDSLKGQYNYLAQNYFSRRIYTDTLSKDSITLVLTDTVSNNHLQGRRAVWQVKYPQVTITNNTTITRPPVGQLYAGVGVGATFKGTDWQAQAGILYKSRTDNITGVNLWGNNRLQYGAELSRYWLISFRRRN